MTYDKGRFWFIASYAALSPSLLCLASEIESPAATDPFDLIVRWRSYLSDHMVRYRYVGVSWNSRKGCSYIWVFNLTMAMEWLSKFKTRLLLRCNKGFCFSFTNPNCQFSDFDIFVNSYELTEKNCLWMFSKTWAVHFRIMKVPKQIEVIKKLSIKMYKISLQIGFG